MSEDQKLVVQNSVTGFFQELGGELLEFEPDRAVIGLTLEKRHLNNAGNLHGGVVASLLDVAMGLCGTWAADPQDRRVAITLSMNVNFSAPAGEGERVRAVASCRKQGHKIFMASCDLLAEAGNLLAFGEGVFQKGALRRDLPRSPGCCLWVLRWSCWRWAGSGRSSAGSPPQPLLPIIC